MLLRVAISMLFFLIITCPRPAGSSVDNIQAGTVPDLTWQEPSLDITGGSMEIASRICFLTPEARKSSSIAAGILENRKAEQLSVTPASSTPPSKDSSKCIPTYQECILLFEKDRKTFIIPETDATHESVWSTKKKAFASALSEANDILQLAGAGYHFVGPEKINGWSTGSVDNIIRGFTTPPQWDTDNFFTNYVGHPYQGCTFYLMGRNNGLGIFGSWLVSTGGSLLWEYFYEAFYEYPSANDLIFTSNVGSLLGEISWQLKKILEKSNKANPTMSKKVLIVLVDPWTALAKQINLGPMWSEERGHINPYHSPVPVNHLTQRWED